MKVLTVLFCAALFLGLSTAVRAEHAFTTNFVCLTEAAGLEAVKYDEAGAIDALITRASLDPNFECYKVEMGYAYRAMEIVHTYMADGVRKAMVLSLDGRGREVYTFGVETYVRDLLHLADERGA